MADFRYPSLADHGRLTWRLQLAAGCVAIAIALTFIAVKFQTKDYLASTSIQQRAGPQYSRMWFDTEGGLVGARQSGLRLTVERWPQGGKAPQTYEFTLTGADAAASDIRWAMDAGLSGLAWITAGASPGPILHLQGVPGGKASFAVPLPMERSALALSVLSDGSAAVAFSDGTVARWEIASGRMLAERRLDLKAADQATADGDYLAVSATGGNELLYHFHDRQDWMLVEESPAPEPPYRLVIPAPGMMAAFTAGGLRTGNKTRNSPGALASVAAHASDLIAAGDFERIFVLPPDGEFYSLAEASPRSLVTASGSQLAVSAAGGTTLLALSVDTRLTPGGRKLSYAGAGFMLLAALLVSTGFVSKGAVGGLRRLFHSKVNFPVTLPEPPPELLRTLASGQAVLWAGAGLSAQAGFPTRNAFLATVLQAASVDGWVPAPAVRKFTGMIGRGEGEAALNELIAMSAPVRDQLISHFRSLYLRFAVPSRSHELLAHVPFASAITTNHDRLLEFMPHDWAKALATLSSEPPEGTDLSFLLRLYGELGAPRTLLLSRAELASALDSAPYTQVLRHVLNARSILFLGCSLEGLLADLAKIGAPAKVSGKHFAVAGVSSPAWKNQVSELSRHYGVEVLACGADQIVAQLPAFLEKIVRELAAAENEAVSSSA
jgi:SIR2-like protein